MSFKEVFNSLKEIFPQVDIRILKAVAIEHINDVDAAVEFIISEVLPVLGAPKEFTLGVSKFVETPDISNDGTNQDCCGQAVVCDVEHIVTENKTANSLSGQEAEQEGPANDLLLEPTPHEDGESIGCAMDAECNISCVQSSSFKEEPFSGSFHSSLVENIQAVDTLVNEEKEMHQLGFFSKSFASTGCIDDDFGGPSLMLVSESSVPSPSGHLVALNESSNSDHHSVVPSESLLVSDEKSNLDHQRGKTDTLFKLDFEPLNLTTGKTEPLKMATVEISNSSPSTVATRSGQIVKSDLLEDFINDTKTYKKILASALDLVLGLAKTVEDEERDALQAKDEASRAGLDIIAKAKDLKEMLMHAKEANYMHAGEVYGERSILATEIRELQSRLLCLADDKDKSLSVIEEMCKTLEARLAIAETEKLSAEQEKINKEENALKELHEQEIMMEKVVEESKRLQQEAEENSKLREFLVDRGRLIDILQGEFAVVCEDVRSLNKRVDQRLPCGGLTYSGRLSLSTSFPRAVNSEDLSNQKVQRVESPVGDSVPVLVVPEPQDPQVRKEGSTTNKSVNAAEDHKAPSDDDWDMFEDADVASSGVSA